MGYGEQPAPQTAGQGRDLCRFHQPRRKPAFAGMPGSATNRCCTSWRIAGRTMPWSLALRCLSSAASPACTTSVPTRAGNWPRQNIARWAGRIRALEVELQRKLNLALIVLAITSGRDPAESRGRGVVERAGRGRDSITAEGAERVRALRKGQLRLSQTQFAALLGLTVTTISSWETGLKEPSAEHYIKMANLATAVQRLWFWEHVGIDLATVPGVAAALRSAQQGKRKIS